MIEDIERSILCSILESVHHGNNISKKLDANLFTVPFHKKIVVGINRIIDLDLPLDTDVIRHKFMEANKWSFAEDEWLINIISHNHFGTIQMFERYYKILEDNYRQKIRKNILEGL